MFDDDHNSFDNNKSDSDCNNNNKISNNDDRNTSDYSNEMRMQKCDALMAKSKFHYFSHVRSS